MKSIICGLLLFAFAFFANPLCADEDKSKELLEAADKGALNEVKLLVKSGADLSAREEEEGATPLILAARAGHPDVVKFLIDSGAEVNAADELNSATALMWASTAEGEEEEGGPHREAPSEENRIAVVKMLIAAKANVNQ
ncbi:MAG: hypothetical protein C5B54_11850, partial [Acidobacteria bacterium]